MSDHEEPGEKEPPNPANTVSEFNKLLEKIKREYDRQNEYRISDESAAIADERVREDERLAEKPGDGEADRPVAADEDGGDRAEAGPSRAASRTITKDDIEVYEIVVKDAGILYVLRCRFCGEGESEYKPKYTPASEALDRYKQVWTDHARKYHKMKAFVGWEVKEKFGTKVEGASADWYRQHMEDFNKYHQREAKKAPKTRGSHKNRENHPERDSGSDTGPPDNAPQPRAERGEGKYNMRERENGQLQVYRHEGACQEKLAADVETTKLAAPKRKDPPVKSTKGKAPAAKTSGTKGQGSPPARGHGKIAKANPTES
ncbi:hypothetical protein DL98DRAFT_601225 [Cadophora sp. DSE1049]|nr:hypothetical protein DL98DRAFT_601225 [Cadophora sp. DSE1049]